MAPKRLTRSALSKLEKEVAKLPLDLRRYEPLHINSKALDSYAVERLRELAHASIGPEDEEFLEGEQGFLYYAMLGDLPNRCHRAFRLYYVRKLGLRVIARRLGVSVQTARRDVVRALTVFARELKRVAREGVVAKGNDD